VNVLPVNFPVPVLSPRQPGKALKMLLGLLTTVQKVSDVRNPLPDMVPEVPAGPEFGVILTVALDVVTVKVAEAVSPLLPVTVTT